MAQQWQLSPSGTKSLEEYVNKAMTLTHTMLTLLPPTVIFLSQYYSESLHDTNRASWDEERENEPKLRVTHYRPILLYGNHLHVAVKGLVGNAREIKTIKKANVTVSSTSKPITATSTTNSVAVTTKKSLDDFFSSRASKEQPDTATYSLPVNNRIHYTHAPIRSLSPPPHSVSPPVSHSSLPPSQPPVPSPPTTATVTATSSLNANQVKENFNNFLASAINQQSVPRQFSKTATQNTNTVTKPSVVSSSTCSHGVPKRQGPLDNDSSKKSVPNNTTVVPSSTSKAQFSQTLSQFIRQSSSDNNATLESQLKDHGVKPTISEGKVNKQDSLETKNNPLETNKTRTNAGKSSSQQSSSVERAPPQATLQVRKDSHPPSPPIEQTPSQLRSSNKRPSSSRSSNEQPPPPKRPPSPRSSNRKPSSPNYSITNTGRKTPTNATSYTNTNQSNSKDRPSEISPPTGPRPAYRSTNPRLNRYGPSSTNTGSSGQTRGQTNSSRAIGKQQKSTIPQTNRDQPISPDVTKMKKTKTFETGTSSRTSLNSSSQTHMAAAIPSITGRRSPVVTSKTGKDKIVTGSFGTKSSAATQHNLSEKELQNMSFFGQQPNENQGHSTPSACHAMTTRSKSKLYMKPDSSQTKGHTQETSKTLNKPVMSSSQRSSPVDYERPSQPINYQCPPSPGPSNNKGLQSSKFEQPSLYLKHSLPPHSQSPSPKSSAKRSLSPQPSKGTSTKYSNTNTGRRTPTNTTPYITTMQSSYQHPSSYDIRGACSAYNTGANNHSFIPAAVTKQKVTAEELQKNKEDIPIIRSKTRPRAQLPADRNKVTTITPIERFTPSPQTALHGNDSHSEGKLPPIEQQPKLWKTISSKDNGAVKRKQQQQRKLLPDKLIPQSSSKSNSPSHTAGPSNKSHLNKGKHFKVKC